jgi:hypothetical protein
MEIDMLSVYDMTPGQIRAAFGKCAESFHKQMGLRKIRDYRLFITRNAEHAEKMLADARHHLAYARAYK